MTLEETLEKIHPANQAAMAASLEHWSNIAMPLHSLGRLQDTVVRIAGMTGDPRVDLKKKALVVMCADNGVVEEGVTQSGQEVTKIVAENFLKEKATARILCKKAGADIFPVDIGITTDSTIIQHKVMYGTKNMAKEPAMTREQAVQALEVGIHMVEELKEKGYGIVATGEMGIGNTTTSSAVTAVLLEQDPAKVTGRGAGLSSAGLEKKISVIRDAIALHKPKKEDPIDVLAKVGGLDIAGMAGVFLGGAACQIPVVADGFISCVAALCAIRICPTVKDYVITSHKSKEPATVMILEALDIPVFLDCDMCLGEGTGAVTIYPILDMAVENLPMRNSVSWIFRERIESILRRCTRLMRKATGGSRDIAPCGRKKSSRRWNGIPIWSILRYRQVRMYCSSACQIWWQMRFIRRAEPGKILWPQFFRESAICWNRREIWWS